MVVLLHGFERCAARFCSNFYFSVFVAFIRLLYCSGVLWRFNSVMVSTFWISHQTRQVSPSVNHSPKVSMAIPVHDSLDNSPSRFYYVQLPYFKNAMNVLKNSIRRRWYSSFWIPQLFYSHFVLGYSSQIHHFHFQFDPFFSDEWKLSNWRVSVFMKSKKGPKPSARSSSKKKIEINALMAMMFYRSNTSIPFEVKAIDNID